MNEFTIYCTPEQTKKAFELGAPIKTEINYTRTGAQLNGIYNDGKTFYYLPTAEQMIGWLEEQSKFKVIAIHNSRSLDWSFHITPKDKNVFASVGYSSRQEATLSAIDCALEYLTNNK